MDVDALLIGRNFATLTALVGVHEADGPERCGLDGPRVPRKTSSKSSESTRSSSRGLRSRCFTKTCTTVVTKIECDRAIVPGQRL